MSDVLLDAFLDTLILLPFLFLLYIIIELLEHKTQVGKPNGALSGKFAPLLGSVTGLVPMCGFSVMAAKLYRHRHITVGTLVAVFIATSDEAFIVLILSELSVLEKLYSLLAFCGLKILFGAAVGYLLDVLYTKRSNISPVTPVCEAKEHVHHDHHDYGHDHSHGTEQEEFSVCEHKHGRREAVSLYLVSPLIHALKIAAFIFACNLLFGFLFYGIGSGNAEAGEEKVIGFLQGSGYWYQPVLCCIVGLIPNCASSVALTETFAVGGIAFGSCLAGLIVNAGLGYLVLLRDIKKWKENLLIILVLFAVGMIAGYCVNAVAIAAGI